MTRQDPADKMQDRNKNIILNKQSRFFRSAKRLDVLLGGSAHDVFAADVFQHQSYYIKFVTNPVKFLSKDNLQKSKQKMFQIYLNIELKLKL